MIAHRDQTPGDKSEVAESLFCHGQIEGSHHSTAILLPSFPDPFWVGAGSRGFLRDGRNPLLPSIKKGIKPTTE